MGSLPMRRIMREDYEKNLGKYILEHPGEWVLYDGGLDGVKFFPTREGVDSELKRHKGVYGYNCFCQKVPRKMPKGIPRDKDLFNLAGEFNARELLREVLKFERKSKKAKLEVCVADARDGGL